MLRRLPLSYGMFAAALAATVSLPSVATAQQTPPSYVKLAVGNARSDIDEWGNENDAAASLAYGMRFHPNFDAEVGYLNFGKAHYRSGVDTLNAKSQALFAAVIGRYPLQQQFSVYGKIGVSYHWNEWSGSVAGVRYNDDDKRLAPLIGVGLSWQFMPEWSADLDYAHFNNVGKSSGRSANIDLVTVGVKYLF